MNVSVERADFGCQITFTVHRVKISKGEARNPHTGGVGTFDFSTYEQAELALEWAYAVHLEQLRTRPEVYALQEHRGGDQRSVYWRKKTVEDGNPSSEYMADYFSYHEVTLRYKVIG